MRKGLIVLWMLLCSTVPATAQVSVGIGLPHANIQINLPLFPELVPIRGYPVYYAPRLDVNYFFYDGMYWVYQDDNWYASSWYNGPWMLVGPEAVPLYILRVPVRYYRQPPAYFHGWRSNAPPRWDEHWGGDWSQRRHGWNQWNRGSAPPPAPLPAYQRKYAGDRYPLAEQQQALHSKNYRYQPRDPEVRQHYQAPAAQNAPAPAPRHEAQGARPERATAPQAIQHPSPPPAVQQSAPVVRHAQPPQRDSESVQRPAPTQAPPQHRAPAAQEQGQQPQQGATQHQQQEPKLRPQEGPQGKQKRQDSERGQGAGQEGDHEKAGGAGPEHKR
jgi:hypothetical protein